MSSSMRNFMEAYSAVHSREVKEELNSGRDLISEMDLSTLNDSDISEIVESVLEGMFEKGYSVDSARSIFGEMFVESNIVGRQEKIDRICEALKGAFNVIDSKASTIAVEEFLKYRNNKKLQESWSARFNQEKRVERVHNQLVTKEAYKLKSILDQLVEKADKSYLETDMKKRQKNNEKARKEMEKMGTSMKNPHFEEVSQIRKGWGEAYTGIYEKMDPVGQEDGDIDNDGDKDSSDEYLMKRRKAIGKAMGKKGKCENCGGKGCEKCKDMKEGVASAIGGAIGDVLHGVGKVAGGAARGVGAVAGGVVKGTKKVVKAVAEPTNNESVDFPQRARLAATLKDLNKEHLEFTDKELDRIESIVNSWED